MIIQTLYLWIKRTRMTTNTRASAVILLVGLGLSKILGFVREMSMAAIFGTTASTDEWLIASVVPNLLFSSFDTTLTNVIIPILADTDHHTDGQIVKNYLDELYTIVVLFSIGVIIITEWQMGLIIHITAPGFHGQKFLSSVIMARIMIPAVLFWNISGTIKGILQSSNVFVPTAIAPLIMNMARFLSIVTLGLLAGIDGIAIGFILSVLLQTLYLICALRFQKIHLRWRWTFRNPYLIYTLKLSLPFFYSNAVGAGGLIVDRILASSLPTGNISALNYSLVLAQLPVTLLLTAFITPWYTRMAKERHNRRIEYKTLISKGFWFTTLLLFPFTIFLVIYRGTILSLIYQHGVFHHSSIRLTAQDFLYWTLGLPASGWTLYLSRVLFANRATRVVLWNSSISIGINIMMDFWLIHPMGGAGLALGTSIATWIRSILMIFQVRYMMSRPIIRKDGFNTSA